MKEDLRDYLLEMQEEIPTEVLESLTDFLEKTGKEEEEMKKRMQELSEGNRSLSMELEKLKTEYDSFIRTRYERDKETEYRNRDHERRLKNQHAEEIRRIRNGTWGAALGVLLIIIGPLMIPFFIQFGETVGTIPGWFMGLFRIMGQFFILIGKGYMKLVNLIPERCSLFVRHLIVAHVTGGAIGTFSWFIVYRQGIRRLKVFYEKRKERAELEGVWGIRIMVTVMITITTFIISVLLGRLTPKMNPMNWHLILNILTQTIYHYILYRKDEG